MNNYSKYLLASTICLFVVITTITFNSCVDGPTIPNEETLTQTDVEWSSLANTPWPTNHGNPQSNGRSQYLGPSIGMLDSKIPLYGIESSIVLSQDNEIIVTTNYSPQRISAMNVSGAIIWEAFAEGNITTTPILGDSAIYWADASGLYASRYDGSRKWKYDKDCAIWNLGINIGKDGAIYCINDNHTLKVIAPTGVLLWALKDERFRTDEHGSPTFSPDGKTLYVQGNSVSVLAIDVENHIVKWVYGEYELFSSPIVNSQGNIFFIPGEQNKPVNKKLHNLNEDGRVQWTFAIDDEYILDNTEPTIDYDGNIFFGGSKLYSVNYRGELRWEYDLVNKNIISPLVSDVEGNIFIGVANLNINSDLSVLSFKNDGTLNWDLAVEGERLLGASPAITMDGQLIFPTFRAFNILLIK